jgi:flagellar hook-associated protein 1 FlgK
MSDVYSIALGAMNVNKKEISFNAHNIANVGVEGYSRLSLDKSSSVIDGQVVGVDIQGVVSNVDEILQDTLYEKISIDSYNTQIKTYLSKMHEEFGQPGQGNSIDAIISDVQIALKDLSESPTSVSSKLQAVQKLESLANKISSVATKFQDMRYQADKDLSSSISSLNTQLESAYKLSNSAVMYPKGTLQRVESENNLRNTVENISKYLDITKYFDSSGAMKVLAAEGVSLVGDSQFFLKYTPTTSANDLASGKELEPVLVSYYSDGGSDLNFNKQIVTGGKSEDVVSSIKNGRIGALINLRDKEIPKALAQLDTLAKGLKDEFNRIHNNGSSASPATKLEGTNLVGRDQIFGFTGKTRIMLVDNDGLQYDNIPALNLDLSNLDTGDGKGKANVEGILQEIQYHFGKKFDTDNAVKVGNLSDIKLSSLSKELTPGGTLDLDLELQNLSNTGSTVQIMAATANDGLGNNILDSYIGTSHTVSAGETQRTGAAGPSLKLNIPGAISYPYTLTVDVRVNDGVSDYDTQLTYTINNPPNNDINGMMNQRFSVISADNDGTTFGPNFVSPLITQTMIQADGNVLPLDSNKKGMIHLASTNVNYHIVIDNLDSSQDGYSGQNIIGTKDNFSYFFGLNDLFVRKDSPENWGNLGNTAMNLDVRRDIKNDSNKFSISKNRQLVDNNNPGNFLNRYEVTKGDTQNLQDLMALSQKKILFGSAGSLPATSITLESYAGEVLGFNTATLSRYEENTRSSSMMKDSIKDKIQNLKGVNINEELANMMVYQQNITANSRVITVAREIEQVLMDIIR